MGARTVRGVTTSYAAPPRQDADPGEPQPEVSGRWLVLAGAASVGSGAVHVAAAGAHGDHPAAVLTFTALAVVQVVAGTAAVMRTHSLVAAAVALAGGASLGGWVLAKTVGLPFVDGLDVVEPVQRADLSAAVLAAVALASGLLALVGAGSRADLRRPLWPSVVAVVAATALGTVATSAHEHAEGEGHTRGTVAAGHAHTDAVPYDPALPIDLGGTPGVSPKQQAAAENLVSLTLARLPQWSDARVAEAKGFRSIGDGFTGTEHLIDQAFLDDGTTLDPDRPESLVYDTRGGGRRLVAAMYMLKPGTPLDQVPDVGGALVQWHVHDNLCYSPEGYVQGITDSSGACPAGQVKPVPAPMVHVWITPHPCGPFAALEGIGAGRIADGARRLCDHAHGAAS